MRVTKYLAAWLLAVVCIPSSAAELSLVSKVKQTGLLELYSSEGCSSCPPADAWLATLKDESQLWRNIIPVAFHVDYWDGIGWKDRFASPDYTRRQHRYAQEGATRAVYTPGFFYNGREWRQWFESQERNFPAANNSGVLRANISGRNIEISFQPTEEIAGPMLINIALLGFDLTTPVKAGENRGRELRHDFIVLGYNQTELSTYKSIWSGTAELPISNINARRKGVAIWVSAANQQRPLQAVGGWL